MFESLLFFEFCSSPQKSELSCVLEHHTLDSCYWRWARLLQWWNGLLEMSFAGFHSTRSKCWDFIHPCPKVVHHFEDAFDTCPGFHSTMSKSCATFRRCLCYVWFLSFFMSKALTCMKFFRGSLGMASKKPGYQVCLFGPVKWFIEKLLSND